VSDTQIHTSALALSRIIDDIVDGKLELTPHFQRRLVWTNKHREHLIDTVLKNLPFPEIFVATKSVNRKTRQIEEMLVDGQQRIRTLRDYVQGTGKILYKEVKRFSELDPDVQDRVLHYMVSVRNLGLRTTEEIKAIFDRINSTDYSLKKMEKLHAMYDGAFKRYCVELGEQEFFTTHKVFTEGVKKRMGDVGFCVILVTTILGGYYNRDEKNEDYLRLYDEDFSELEDVQAGLDVVFDFIESCDLPPKSRAWRVVDLFTLLVEAHHLLVTLQMQLDPAAAGVTLTRFYDHVSHQFKQPGAKHDTTLPVGAVDVARYLKAATKATTERYARVERSDVLQKVLRSAAVEPKKKSTGKKK
jgi:hypothetical protein